MDWVIFSGLMYFFSVTLYLGLRKLQGDGVSNDINNPAMFFLGWVLFGLIAIFTQQTLVVEWKYIIIMFVATYFCSYLGNKFSLDAIKQADNPGFSLIIQKSYAIYTAVAAVLLFQAELTTKNLIAILIVIFFLSLMMWQDRKVKSAHGSRNWIVLSLLAFFSFGNLVLISKWLLDEGISPLARSFYVQLFVTLMFGWALWRNMKSKPELKEQLLNKKHYLWFVIIGVSNSLFNLFLQYGIQSAPNVGYVNIINAASISAITLLSAWLFKDKLTPRKIIGMLGATVGIILLFL